MWKHRDCRCSKDEQTQRLIVNSSFSRDFVAQTVSLRTNRHNLNEDSENIFGNVARLGRNQRYESWRMPYAHSSLGIPRLASRGGHLPCADRKLPN